MRFAVIVRYILENEDSQESVSCDHQCHFPGFFKSYLSRANKKSYPMYREKDRKQAYYYATLEENEVIELVEQIGQDKNALFKNAFITLVTVKLSDFDENQLNLEGKAGLKSILDSFCEFHNPGLEIDKKDGLPATFVPKSILHKASLWDQTVSEYIVTERVFWPPSLDGKACRDRTELLRIARREKMDYFIFARFASGMKTIVDKFSAGGRERITLTDRGKPIHYGIVCLDHESVTAMLNPILEWTGEHDQAKYLSLLILPVLFLSPNFQHFNAFVQDNRNKTKLWLEQFFRQDRPGEKTKNKPEESCIYIPRQLYRTLAQNSELGFSFTSIEPIEHPENPTELDSFQVFKWCELFKVIRNANELRISQRHTMLQQSFVPKVFEEIGMVFENLGTCFHMFGHESPGRAVAYAFNCLAESKQDGNPLKILRDKIDGIPTEANKKKARKFYDKISTLFESRPTKTAVINWGYCLKILIKIQKLFKI